MNIKDVWKDAEGGSLTWEQFEEKATGAKFVDVKEGGYVSKSKHDSEIEAKDLTIQQLNDTIAKRDNDLSTIKQQLETAGQDAEKLTTLSNDLTALQTKYETDTQAYKDQLSKQAREFAIKEYAATKQFTSGAAKRDYIEMMKQSEDVKLNKKGSLIGLEDFDEEYAKENEDAFVKEEQGKQEPPENNNGQLPMFVQQTGQTDVFQNETGKEHFGFSFIPQESK